MRIRKSVLFPVLAAILSFIFVAGYFDRGDKPEAALSPENGVLEVENGTMTGVGKRLVNPDASEEAKRLMSYLVDNFGKHILSGQQSSGSGLDMFQIKGRTGKFPAVRGFDLMDYSPSRAAFGVVGKDTEAAIKWWQEDGGIVTFCWHWNAPKDLINQEPDKLWWSGFYTKATTFDVQKALKATESEDYKLILRDIDAIAVQLKKLQDARVPVLWRPLHEAEGGWFWWGAKGPDAYKKLYKLLYDRLVNEHQLNNLLWVWNAPKADWYPGDEYVDIASCDIYGPGQNYGPNTGAYDNLVSVTKGKKLIALAENGVVPDPDKLIESQTRWSWFCTWSGEFVTDEKYTGAEQLKKVYNHDYVITLDELPDLKKYPMGK
jgi:mannan endo-1,4-beta-mannosidase